MVQVKTNIENTKELGQVFGLNFGEDSDILA